VISETTRIGVGELFLARQHGDQRALGQAAVADLAALRAADAAGLAGGEGRHVVVEHEAVLVLAGQRVDDLLVAAGAQRGDHQRLRLAAGEQRRAVGARQHAVADLDRAHGAGVAAVDARLAVEDLAAHDAASRSKKSSLTLVEPSARSLRLRCGRWLLGGAAGGPCAPACW
jgi:hypothetical protein